MATQEKYHVGIDVHDYERHTHGRKEVIFAYVGVHVDNYHQVEVRVDHEEYEASDWVSAAEYAIELVQSQHPLASVELAYVKEFCVC